MAYNEKRKQYRYRYEKEHLKRVPLDMPIEDYERIKRIASYVGEPVNRYIKRAVAQRLSKDFLDLYDAAEAAGKTEDEYIEETIKAREIEKKAFLDSMEREVVNGKTIYISGENPSGGLTDSAVVEIEE